jgi:hypothetical protein
MQVTFDLAARLSELPERRQPSPWVGHEHVKGWAVFALPFESGDVLALRVLPQSNVTPYRSLYHRDPEGKWELYVDGPKECTCTRQYGQVCSRTGNARLQIRWTGPATAKVVMHEPAIEWSFTASTNWRLRAVNAVNGHLPLSTWRFGALIRAREVAARVLGMGKLELRSTTPSGHLGTLMPQEIYYIDESRARVNGRDLGRPVQLSENPRLGNLPLPSRGVLAIAEGMWRVADQAEFERLTHGEGSYA